MQEKKRGAAARYKNSLGNPGIDYSETINLFCSTSCLPVFHIYFCLFCLLSVVSNPRREET
jgi:hypothetical protein